MLNRKINWLQGICILLIGMLIVGVAWSALQENKQEELQEQIEEEEESSEENYIITLTSDQSMNDSYNELEVGETLFFFGGKKEMGEIIDLKLVDRTVEVKSKGKYHLVTDPDEKRIEIQVLVQGKREPTNFMVNTVQLKIGQSFYPQTDKCRIKATVLRIEKEAGGAEK